MAAALRDPQRWASGGRTSEPTRGCTVGTDDLDLASVLRRDRDHRHAGMPGARKLIAGLTTSIDARTSSSQSRTGEVTVERLEHALHLVPADGLWRPWPALVR